MTVGLFLLPYSYLFPGFRLCTGMVFLSFQVYVFTKQSIVEQPFAHRLCCKCSVILLGDYCFNAQSAPNEFVLALFNLFLTA